MSYAYMVMYSEVLPSYNHKGGKDGEKQQDVIKADDPSNREKVRQFLDRIE